MRSTAEPSADRGRLYSSAIAADSDPKYVRRLAVAFALAVGLHEVLAGLWPRSAPPKPEPTGFTEIITLATRPPTPQPPPPPTPRPTPQPVVTYSKVASVAQAAPRAAAPVRRHMGGRASLHVVKIKPPHAVNATPEPRSIVANNGVGVANGGSGSGGGPGAGDGGAGGNGSGLGGVGNGSGAGVAPCGVVILNPTSLQQNSDGSRTVTIRLEVHVSDGSIVVDDLGWKFYYRREADDPFSKAGELARTPTLLQLPPPGYDLEGRQKPATVFAVKHTDRAGFTDLQDCPTQ